MKNATCTNTIGDPFLTAYREDPDFDWKQSAEQKRQREEKELERKRAEAEKQRLEDIARQRKDNERRRQEALAKEAEDLRNREIAEEDARLAAMNSGAMVRYQFALQQSIMRNWVAPA